MHVICRLCKRWHSWRAKGGPRLAEMRCEGCGAVGLNKGNAQEIAALRAVNSLEVDRHMAAAVAAAAPADRKLLEEIHEMLRLSLTAQLRIVAGPVGRRIALTASRPRLTLLRGGLSDGRGVKKGAA